MNREIRDKIKRLGIEYQLYKCNYCYLSEDNNLIKLIKNNVKSCKIILLVAPQGSGKTTLIKDNFHLAGCLYPTRMLTDQIDNKIKNTYFSIDDLTSWLNTHEDMQNNLLFIDEFHKIIQYSKYAYNEQTAKILKLLEDRGERPLILSTATPELIYYCLPDDLLHKIDLIIDVKTNHESYINGLVLLEDCYYYSNNADKYYFNFDKVVDLILSNNSGNNKQIVLINSKASCKTLENKLNDTGLKAVSITSLDIHDDKTTKKEEINNIVFNGSFNADVLITTSWIDTGISFKDKTINNIYCFIGSSWDKGDLTLIKQFTARTRKSKPTLFTTIPELDNTREYKFLFNHLINENDTLDNIDQTINNRIDSPYYYNKIIDLIYNTAKNQADLYNDGILPPNPNINNIGIYCKQGVFDKTYHASKIICNYLAYTLKEKVNIAYKYKYMDLDINNYIEKYKSLWSDCFNIPTNRIILDQSVIGKYINIKSADRNSSVINLLNHYVKNEIKFKSKDIIEEINKIDKSNKYSSIKRYIDNNTELSNKYYLELTDHKSKYIIKLK
jgi:hypothetical protein